MGNSYIGTVFKVGNSHAILIPSYYKKLLSIQEGDSVTVNISEVKKWTRMLSKQK